jgi:hypothetical protein
MSRVVTTASLALCHIGGTGRLNDDTNDSLQFLQNFAIYPAQDLRSNSKEDLYSAVGIHCAQVSRACSSLRDIIFELRERGETLVNAVDYDRAMELIASGYASPPTRQYLKKCTSALKDYLRMPPSLIPKQPSLTGSLPQWRWRGDQVDVYDTPRKTWWHAVIIDDMPENSRLIHVYWVGWAPCEFGSVTKSRAPSEYDKNPTFVRRGDVRSHEPGKCSVGSQRTYSVAYIKSQYCVVDISGEKDEQLESDESPVHSNPSNVLHDVSKLPPNHSDPSDTKVSDPASPGQESGDDVIGGKRNRNGNGSTGTDSKVSDPANAEVSPGQESGDNVIGGKRNRNGNGSTGTDSKVSDPAIAKVPGKNSGDVGISSKLKPKRRPVNGPATPHSNSVDAVAGYRASAASFQQIVDLTVTDRAIATLQSLDKGGDISPKELNEWIECLKNRCQYLAQLYGNQDYIVLGEETLCLLENYGGREFLTAAELKTMHDLLKLYGWVISPRMWTKEEVIVFCVILLDPRLYFNGILQKDKGSSGESLQNRGMANLNSRVQQIMYSRLESYGFIDKGHLPPDVPAAVVLNSGGSYLQLTTWEYLASSRFVTDPTVHEAIIEVSGAPGFTHCDAIYVATKTRHQGSVVYVSVSPLEVYGPKKGKEDPKAWDGRPLKPALPDEVISMIDNVVGTWATERVLYWHDGQIHIQSITAFGTGMFMLQLKCTSLKQKVTETSCFCNFNWETKCSVMQRMDGNASVKIIRTKTKIKEHKLSFGTQRILKFSGKTDPNDRPKLTRAQQFHKDGPTLYDDRLFDSVGNLKPDGPPETSRNTPLTPVSPGRSTSGLFAFFAQTFLGLKPGGKPRVNPADGLRLHISVGKAVLFYFDEDHQVFALPEAF